MPLDPLYEDSTSTFLAGQNQANVPEPAAPTPNTSITSIAKAVGRGIGQGGASLFGAAADTASGLSQVYVDPDSAAGAALNPVEQAAQDKQINDALAKGKAGSLFQSSAGTAAYNFADTLKPDPTNSTKIDQIVQGAVSGLTQIVPAAILGGPLAGAAVGGASIGLGGAEDLKRQGVDVNTRTAVGALEGVAGGLGAVLPAGGSTLARTAGLVALGGPGFTIAQSAAEKAILRNSNYDKLADQINPLDPVNIAASTLIAGTFGAAHAVGAARAAGKADATVTPPADTSTPITAMPVDARKALKYNAPALDQYATQAAQAAGVPPEMLLFIKNGGEKSNSNQVSPAGAKGVMQFTDSTYKQFGKGDPKDPVNSIDAAAAYSADLLKRYDGDVRAAITEYNGGIKQAEAVHAGGKPTDPETIAYLQRYDEYAANHQISNLKFDPTPEQTDAALVSHSQSIVDDAHIGPADDVAAMSAHQDAFELAARQMDAGEPVDVTSVMPPEFARSDVLGDYARQIGDARVADDASVTTAAKPKSLADFLEQAHESNNLDHALQGFSIHGSTPEARAYARQLQDLNLKAGFEFKNQYEGSEKGVEGEYWYNGYRPGETHSVAMFPAGHAERERVILHEATHAALYDKINKYAEMEKPTSPEDVRGVAAVAKLEAIRQEALKVAGPDDHYGLTDLHEFTSELKTRPDFQAFLKSKDLNGKSLWEHVKDVVKTMLGIKGEGTYFDKAMEATDSLLHRDRPETAEPTREATQRPAAEQETAAKTEGAASAVEQNVRQAALEQPDTVAHLDANAGPQEGKISDLLKTIDDEHANTLQDASLLQVAANCFISSGD